MMLNSQACFLKGGIMDTTTQIIKYESGELDLEGVLNLFSKLVKCGDVWRLQGHYGRTAAALIENDLLTINGEITEYAKEQMEEE